MHIFPPFDDSPETVKEIGAPCCCQVKAWDRKRRKRQIWWELMIGRRPLRNFFLVKVRQPCDLGRRMWALFRLSAFATEGANVQRVQGLQRWKEALKLLVPGLEHSPNGGPHFQDSLVGKERTNSSRKTEGIHIKRSTLVLKQHSTSYISLTLTSSYRQRPRDTLQLHFLLPSTQWLRQYPQ